MTETEKFNKVVEYREISERIAQKAKECSISEKLKEAAKQLGSEAMTHMLCYEFGYKIRDDAFEKLERLLEDVKAAAEKEKIGLI